MSDRVQRTLHSYFKIGVWGFWGIANMYRFCKSYVDLPDSSHEDECEHCKAERLEREKDHQKSN